MVTIEGATPVVIIDSGGPKILLAGRWLGIDPEHPSSIAEVLRNLPVNVRLERWVVPIRGGAETTPQGRESREDWNYRRQFGRRAPRVGVVMCIWARFAIPEDSDSKRTKEAANALRNDVEKHSVASGITDRGPMLKDELLQLYALGEAFLDRDTAKERLRDQGTILPVHMLNDLLEFPPNRSRLPRSPVPDFDQAAVAFPLGISSGIDVGLPATAEQPILVIGNPGWMPDFVLHLVRQTALPFKIIATAHEFNGLASEGATVLRLGLDLHVNFLNPMEETSADAQLASCDRAAEILCSVLNGRMDNRAHLLNLVDQLLREDPTLIQTGDPVFELSLQGLHSAVSEELSGLRATDHIVSSVHSLLTPTLTWVGLNAKTPRHEILRTLNERRVVFAPYSATSAYRTALTGVIMQLLASQGSGHGSMLVINGAELVFARTRRNDPLVSLLSELQRFGVNVVLLTSAPQSMNSEVVGLCSPVILGPLNTGTSREFAFNLLNPFRDRRITLKTPQLTHDEFMMSRIQGNAIRVRATIPHLPKAASSQYGAWRTHPIASTPTANESNSTVTEGHPPTERLAIEVLSFLHRIDQTVPMDVLTLQFAHADGNIHSAASLLMQRDYVQTILQAGVTALRITETGKQALRVAGRPNSPLEPVSDQTRNQPAIARASHHTTARTWNEEQNGPSEDSPSDDPLDMFIGPTRTVDDQGYDHDGDTGMESSDRDSPDSDLGASQVVLSSSHGVTSNLGPEIGITDSSTLGIQLVDLHTRADYLTWEQQLLASHGESSTPEQDLANASELMQELGTSIVIEDENSDLADVLSSNTEALDRILEALMGQYAPTNMPRQYPGISFLIEKQEIGDIQELLSVVRSALLAETDLAIARLGQRDDTDATSDSPETEEDEDEEDEEEEQDLDHTANDVRQELDSETRREMHMQEASGLLVRRAERSILSTSAPQPRELSPEELDDLNNTATDARIDPQTLTYAQLGVDPENGNANLERLQTALSEQLENHSDDEGEYEANLRANIRDEMATALAELENVPDAFKADPLLNGHAQCRINQSEQMGNIRASKQEAIAAATAVDDPRRPS